VSLAEDTEVVRLTGAPVGFAGPVGLKNLPLVADLTLTSIQDGISGALAADTHYVHVVYGRDFVPWLNADLRTVVSGDRCGLCGGELYEKKGNELGHIFKLGYKYTRSMQVHYLDENGQTHIPLMGTYGIGIDRTLASVIEEHHDDEGIIWPMTIAPYQVIIIPITYAGQVKAVADSLAANLEQSRVEVLLDDRNERPGVKFKDADLMGIPYRVVVGEKNLARDAPVVEVKRRGEASVQPLEVSKAEAELIRLVYRELGEER
jgi:prolyl-tRNA synthetase